MRWKWQGCAKCPSWVSEEGDAIQDRRECSRARRRGTNMLTITSPNPSCTTTSAAVPPNAEAHLESLVTQLIKSSWGLRWDMASGMQRLEKPRISESERCVNLCNVYVHDNLHSDVGVYLCMCDVSHVHAATCPLVPVISNQSNQKENALS